MSDLFTRVQHTSFWDASELLRMCRWTILHVYLMMLQESIFLRGYTTGITLWKLNSSDELFDKAPWWLVRSNVPAEIPRYVIYGKDRNTAQGFRVWLRERIQSYPVTSSNFLFCSNCLALLFPVRAVNHAFQSNQICILISSFTFAAFIS